MPLPVTTPRPKGLLRAILDAIHGEDDRLGGMAVTRLTTPLVDTELGVLNVETTLGFGEFTDGTGDALLLVGGELVSATGRTDTSFTGLTRGLEGSQLKTVNPITTLVYDFARNKSAVDLIRRALLVRFAIGTDLDTIGRNLGLHRCPGLTDDQYRQIIELVAYMPRQPLSTFTQVLDIVFPGDYDLIRRVSEPYTVHVNIPSVVTNTKKGKFFLNGGEPQLTTGALTVDTAYPINHVIGVFDDTPLTRRGWRGPAFTNYFLPGGSFLGSTITLDSSPGAAGSPVIVDYGAFEAHYLADDENVVDDGDFWAYLSDDSALVFCLLDLVAAGGIEIKVGIKV